MTEASQSTESLVELSSEDNLQDDTIHRGKWKRHEFSDYLTKTGVSVALANAVLELRSAEERPSDPVEFVRTRIQPNNEDVTEIEVYRSENEKLQSKLDGLCEERDRLLERKQRVQKEIV